MKTLRSTLAVAVASLLVGLSSSAALAQQQPPQRVSPPGIAGSVIPGSEGRMLNSREAVASSPRMRSPLRPLSRAANASLRLVVRGR